MLNTLAGLALGFSITAVFSSPAIASHCPYFLTHGTNGEDYLVASDDRADEIRGYDGSDYIRGKDCADTLRGGEAPDNVHGAYGNDNIYGFDGSDHPNYCNILFTYCGELVGGAGSDLFEAGWHTDLIEDTYGGGDNDYGLGEGGDDTIRLDDGDSNDGAHGGGGWDRCVVDASTEKDSTCEA